MSDNKKVLNVPNLRFSDEEWIAYNLNENCEFCGGGTPSTKIIDYWNGNIPWISSSDIMETSFDISISRKITKEAVNNSATKICPPDSILIVSRVGVGKIGIANTNICTSQDFTNIIKYGFDKLFLAYNLKNKIKLLLSQTQGTSIKGISSAEIKKLNIYAPGLNNQIKISNLLKLIDKRIESQNKIIEDLKTLKNTIRSDIFSKIINWIKINDLILSNDVSLSRGNIIPKHIKDSTYYYPVYSSSIHNNGLMGYHNSYMFDKELITWSIDGGGDFFYRPKHKFNVTNVSGILELNDEKYDYFFVCEALKYQHSSLHFDYQSKAHPSIIKDLYKIPNLELNKQKEISLLLHSIEKRIDNEKNLLSKIIKVQEYLLNNLFI